MTDFSNYPVSVTEVQGGDIRDSKRTPRDALISLLRALDAGDLACDRIIIVYGTSEETGYSCAGEKDSFNYIGMLEWAKMGLLS